MDSLPPFDMARVEAAAAHLRSARIELAPRVGTTVYSIDTHMIDAFGQGANAPFGAVLLRLPGVTPDSRASGALHVRAEHANLQYRINGVQLPDSIIGIGQAIDTRVVERIDFMRGALPAQYGLRSAGIVDIQAKEGGPQAGARIGLLAGSHDHVEPGAELFGASGALDYYLAGSYLSNSLGIENPLPARTAMHDRTRQARSFGNLSYYLDENTRLGMLFGSYNGRFQLPDNPDLASRLDQNQKELSRFIVLSAHKSIRGLDYQLSGFHQYSELRYLADPIASGALRSDRATGLQLDLGFRLRRDHTLRAGLAHTRQAARGGDTGQTGRLSSLYLQDEWQLASPLTLNYGLRFDKAAASADQQQWSPRLNLAYQLGAATGLHAGYARHFTPPQVPVSGQVRAERSHHYDVGLSHRFGTRLSVTADAYYNKIRNLLDQGQFGQAPILAPFNYARGYARGLELSAAYSDKDWGGYLNVTLQQAQGMNIVTGQSLFGAQQLAYIATHYIHLDHDQAATLSGGAHYHFGDSQLSADFLYGSGLRKTPEGGAPNSASLPSYATVNAALTHTWKHTGAGKLEGRIALVNLFDKSYLIRDGSAAGGGVRQYGQRRSVFVGLSNNF
jgi:outer membrane receptor protein involved in Fe transport